MGDRKTDRIRLSSQSTRVPTIYRPPAEEATGTESPLSELNMADCLDNLAIIINCKGK